MHNKLLKHTKDRNIAKMTKWKNFPQKKFQEEMTARELFKTDINNISEQEFRITVIKLIAELVKHIEDSRESTAAEIKDLRNSHNELRNAINEMQNKLDTVTTRMEEAEERIDEIEDKIMENDEAGKKRERKLPDHEGRIREVNDSMK